MTIHLGVLGQPCQYLQRQHLKSKISRPYFPREPHSKVRSRVANSQSSPKATAACAARSPGAPGESTSEDLESRAHGIVKLLRSSASASRDDPVQQLLQLVSRNVPRERREIVVESRPGNDLDLDLHIEICEVLVDQDQKKVWVRSEVSVSGSGPSSGSNGKKNRSRMVIEAVDMLWFDDRGTLVAIEGSARPVKRSRDADEMC